MEDMMMMMEQNQVLPSPLYIPDQCTDQLRLRGLSRKREILSGFHQVALRSGPDRLRPQGLKEYSDSYLTLDFLRPVLGSKCLVTQTMGNYLGSDLRRKPQRVCFRLPPRLLIFYIIFLLCILIGLTSLASIYSQAPVLF
jgi:hypothetical protein